MATDCVEQIIRSGKGCQSFHDLVICVHSVQVKWFPCVRTITETDLSCDPLVYGVSAKPSHATRNVLFRAGGTVCVRGLCRVLCWEVWAEPLLSCREPERGQNWGPWRKRQPDSSLLLELQTSGTGAQRFWNFWYEVNVSYFRLASLRLCWLPTGGERRRLERLEGKQGSIGGVWVLILQKRLQRGPGGEVVHHHYGHLAA